MTNMTHDKNAQPRLSADQVEFYNREGYLLPDLKVFDESTFQRLVAHFDRKLAEWPSDRPPEAMDTPHFSDHKLLEWALAPEVVDLVEPILGPDIVLFSTHFICKPKGTGQRVPWHEDSAYWRKLIDPMEVVTIWLALDPSTAENGCMYVIPKTHNTGKKGFSDYRDVNMETNVFQSEIIPSQLKEELAIPCVLRPNECSLHDGRTQHGSPANTSDSRRCGWTIRFVPAYCRLDPEARQRHLMYLARGRNLADQPLANPDQDYPEVMNARSQSGFKVH